MTRATLTNEQIFKRAMGTQYITIAEVDILTDKQLDYLWKLRDYISVDIYHAEDNSDYLIKAVRNKDDIEVARREVAKYKAREQAVAA
jgi:hypothetical protein